MNKIEGSSSLRVKGRNTGQKREENKGVNLLVNHKELQEIIEDIAQDVLEETGELVTIDTVLSTFKILFISFVEIEQYATRRTGIKHSMDSTLAMIKEWEERTDYLYKETGMGTRLYTSLASTKKLVEIIENIYKTVGAEGTIEDIKAAVIGEEESIDEITVAPLQ